MTGKEIQLFRFSEGEEGPHFEAESATFQISHPSEFTCRRAGWRRG